jgi:hypothetical protein
MSLAIGRLVTRALAAILESAHRPRDELKVDGTRGALSEAIDAPAFCV